MKVTLNQDEIREAILAAMVKKTKGAFGCGIPDDIEFKISDSNGVNNGSFVTYLDIEAILDFG